MEQIVHGSIVDENNLYRLHKCCFDKYNSSLKIRQA